MIVRERLTDKDVFLRYMKEADDRFKKLIEDNLQENIGPHEDPIVLQQGNGGRLLMFRCDGRTFDYDLNQWVVDEAARAPLQREEHNKFCWLKGNRALFYARSFADFFTYIDFATRTEVAKEMLVLSRDVIFYYEHFGEHLSTLDVLENTIDGLNLKLAPVEISQWEKGSELKTRAILRTEGDLTEEESTLTITATMDNEASVFLREHMVCKYRLNSGLFGRMLYLCILHAFDSNKADVYQSAMATFFHSHAVCEAIGKKRLFNTNGFKMLLEEAQEVVVYSKAHFKAVSDNRDDRFSGIIKETWDNIVKIDHLKFIRAATPSKDGCINDLECHLVVKKDDLELIFIIHVNKMAFQLAFAHLKHELNISGDLIRDIIYLSLLKDFADGYCRDKPLEKALDKIVDGCDIRIVSKLRDVLTVQFIDGSLLDVSDFINDIGGLRYTYSLNYTVEGR